METESLTFKVAGTPYDGRQEVLKKIFSIQSFDIPVILKSEKDNEHDRFAVSVWKNKDKLGYVPRSLSQVVSESLQLLIDAKIDLFQENDLLCANLKLVFGE